MSRESENKLNCHSLQALAIDASFFCMFCVHGGQSL